MSMISVSSYSHNMLSKSQCLISAQESNYGVSMSQQNMFKSKEDNLYNSVFSKLAYHKSIEEVSNLIRIYNNPVNNNHDALFSILTQEKYRELASELYNLKIKRNKVNYYEKGYEKIRINIILSFESLLYSMYQTKLAASNKRTYEGFKKDSEILHDTEKLKAFIENLSITSHILPEVVVSAPLMKIKPEYSLYMKKYGVPANGIWKPDLLAEMVEQVKTMHPHKSSVYKETVSPKKSTAPSNNETQYDRISMLQSNSEGVKLGIQTEEATKENLNYVMEIPPLEKQLVSSNMSPSTIPSPPSTMLRRRTREEIKRNPIQQIAISRLTSPLPRVADISSSVANMNPINERAEGKEKEEEKEETEPNHQFVKSDYIPWEQWEMIPLAYWNALLR